MKHAEVVIARRAVEEGRGLVVIVNKMDLLRGKHKSLSYEKIMEVVPQEIQTIIPQVSHVIISSTYVLQFNKLNRYTSGFLVFMPLT